MTRFALAVPAAVLVLATAVPASAAPGATPFTSPAGSTLTKATVSYTPGPVTTVGTVTASAHYPTDLATGAVAVVVSGAHVDGINLSLIHISAPTRPY